MYDQLWTGHAMVSVHRHCLLIAVRTAVQGRENPWLSRVEVFEVVQYLSRVVEARSLPMPS